MAKKVLAFDLDGTLAPSKSTIPGVVAAQLTKLLEHYEICIISGAKYELIDQQVLQNLPAEPKQLKHLHIMPTSGTRYYAYDAIKQKWQLQYADDFTKAEKQRIIAALEEGLEESGYKPEKTYGETIEDRESQITLSILGQDIVAELGEKGVEIKESWDDAESSKKLRLRDIIAPKIPEFEVRAAGATSIDVTKPGIDKAYGMRRLIEALGIDKQDILFFGDKLQEGGNDYPVKKAGIDTLEVANWQDTSGKLAAILHVIA